MDRINTKLVLDFVETVNDFEKSLSKKLEKSIKTGFKDGFEHTNINLTKNFEKNLQEKTKKSSFKGLEEGFKASNTFKASVFSSLSSPQGILATSVALGVAGGLTKGIKEGFDFQKWEKSISNVLKNSNLLEPIIEESIRLSEVLNLSSQEVSDLYLSLENIGFANGNLDEITQTIEQIAVATGGVTKDMNALVKTLTRIDSQKIFKKSDIEELVRFLGSDFKKALQEISGLDDIYSGVESGAIAFDDVNRAMDRALGKGEELKSSLSGILTQQEKATNRLSASWTRLGQAISDSGFIAYLEKVSSFALDGLSSSIESIIKALDRVSNYNKNLESVRKTQEKQNYYKSESNYFKEMGLSKEYKLSQASTPYGAMDQKKQYDAKKLIEEKMAGFEEWSRLGIENELKKQKNLEKEEENLKKATTSGSWNEKPIINDTIPISSSKKISKNPYSDEIENLLEEMLKSYDRYHYAVLSGNDELIKEHEIKTQEAVHTLGTYLSENEAKIIGEDMGATIALNAKKELEKNPVVVDPKSKLREDIEKAIKGLDIFSDSLNYMDSSMMDLNASVQAFSSGDVSNGIASLSGFFSNSGGFIDSFVGDDKAFKGLANSIGGAVGAGLSVISGIFSIVGASVEKKYEEKLERNAQNFEDTMDRVNSAYDKNIEIIEKQTELLQEQFDMEKNYLEEQLKAGKIDYETYNKKMESVVSSTGGKLEDLSAQKQVEEMKRDYLEEYYTREKELLDEKAEIEKWGVNDWEDEDYEQVQKNISKIKGAISSISSAKSLEEIEQYPKRASRYAWQGFSGEIDEPTLIQNSKMSVIAGEYNQRESIRVSPRLENESKEDNITIVNNYNITINTMNGEMKKEDIDNLLNEIARHSRANSLNSVSMEFIRGRFR